MNQSQTVTAHSKSRTTYDGLGRPIKVETLDPSNNAVKSTVDTEYDSCACSPAGKLKRQSMPYAPGGTVLWTNYVYDGLGRTLQIIQPHTSGSGSAGTTTYAYAGNRVTVTDPAGRWKRYLQNALGNLVQVIEPNPAGGADFETYYTYNVRDQLTLVQMPRPNQFGGTYTQTRTFVYNLTTGLLTSATNPENGTVTYTYLGNNQVNYKQDAKGQRVEFLYDVHNRVTKMTPKDSGGNVQPCEVVEYFYDLAANSYGRLSAVQYGSKELNGQNQPLCPKGLHREEYTYTAGGRATNKTLKLTRKFTDLPNNEERTAQIAINYEYSNLLLNKVYYPGTHVQAGYQAPVLPVAGAVYQYTYDAFGRPTGETRQEPSQSPVSIVDQVTYNTFGALTQMRKTIALQTETRAYDAFQRLTSMTQFDGTAITYNYAQTANDGKIVSQTTGSETVNYIYDSLGRLTQAATAGAGGWGLAWMYDGWGNRLQQSAVKGTVPTMVSTTDPATNRIQAHSYDANGNTTYTPQQGTMTYDVFNRLKTVAADTYGYDPANKRLWKNDDFTFWGASGERIGRYSAVKLIEDQNGTLVHTFVFQKVQTDEYFGGRRLTTQDRLGSVGSYYPYGEAKSGTVSDADSFATYCRDSTGLDYADQRYLSASSGRFITSDPYMATSTGANNPVDPSTWNRYSYVAGDPVNREDRRGTDWYHAGASLMADVWGFGGGYPCYVAGWAPGAFCALQIDLHLAFEPPPSEQRPPECFAQLKYRPVKNPIAQAGLAVHTFWWVQASNGTTWVISGGWGPNNTLIVDVAPGSVGLQGADNVANASTAWSSGLSAAVCIAVENMLNGANAFPDGLFTYSVLIGPNSNTVSRYIGGLGGFFVSPPLISYGWGAELQLP